jgi:hypothetical protein
LRRSPAARIEGAAALLVLIATEGPAKLDAAAVRFLGRACLERWFITLDDAQFLVACLTQLERADDESSAAFAVALERLRLERTAGRLRGRA